MSRLLIIEDDPDIAHSLRFCLEREGGFEVEVAADGESGLDALRREPPEMLILDLNLPSLDGVDVCEAVRRDPSTARVPIIMLTARVSEREMIQGLNQGADDYMTKPFSLKELLARVRAVLRRTGGVEEPARDPILRTEHLELDEIRRLVAVQGDPITLTRKEFDLLADLMRQRGRVLSRERLLERVWSYEHPGATRTVDVHVRQLRKKLGDNPDDPRIIKTQRGFGYQFLPKVSRA